MMLQLSLAIDSYNPAKHGELKLSSLKEHAIKVFNGMSETIRSSVRPQQDEKPSAQFLFGGYSWFRKAFQLWHISYRARMGGFVANPVPWVGYREEFHSVGFSYSEQNRTEWKKIGRLGIIGDVPQVKLAKQLIKKRIKENFSKGLHALGMVPFEVVRDMLRQASPMGTIGGSPQMVAVHQFMQARPIGIYWPNRKSSEVSIQGRRTLGYEKIDRYILDPDTLELESPYMPEKVMPISE